MMATKLSPAKKAWIIRKIKGGKSKYQTAQELGINYLTVLKRTRHFPNNPKGRTGIRGNTLEMLQEIMKKGYTFCTPSSSTVHYQTLKKYFPMLQKTRYQNKSIIFLEDKAHIAVKAYLDQYSYKIISYNELKMITKLFGIQLSKSEKLSSLAKTKVRIYL